MNYLYKIKGKDIILNEQEHLVVKEGLEKGLDIIFLRNDTLGINPKRVDLFTETTEPTPQQSEEHQKTLKLNSPTEIIWQDEKREKSDEDVNWQVKRIRQITEEWSKKHLKVGRTEKKY